MILNEDNALENIWIIYIVFGCLTLGYYMYYNLFAAFIYAGITLELALRVLDFFVKSALHWAFQRRRPTLAAI
jgi:hypothetical protein